MEGTFKNCKSDERFLGIPVKTSKDERLEDIAWWERKKKKEVMDEALEFYLSTKQDIPKRPNA